jgi:DNA-binding CsgD family transcriptional regulator
MQDMDTFSSLIGNIYDAVSKPDLWTPTLHKIKDYIGGCGLALFSCDAAGATQTVFYDDGCLSPELLCQLGETLSSGPTNPPAEIQWSLTSHDEPARSGGPITAWVCVVDRSITRFTLLAVLCHRHDYVETLRQTRRLIPHIRRAIAMKYAIDSKKAELAAFAALLNSIDAAILLVGRCGEVLHSNANGEALLVRGILLRTVGTKLAATNAIGQKDLYEALSAAQDMSANDEVTAVPLAALDGERYIAHILPIASFGGHHSGANPPPVAAIFIRQTTFGLSASPEVVAKIFRLTPSEVRVLFTIVNIGTISEAAEAMGIGVTTFKTHLQRVFIKTNTNRQAELVKLLASYANPLAS